MLDINSKVKDVYNNPIGRDVLNKIMLQYGRGSWLVTNPIIMNLKLKTISRLVKKHIGEDLFRSLTEVLNSIKEEPEDNEGREYAQEAAWWRKAVIYQIYPRSFMDSDGDGIGDLKGILSKLDYLKELGVDALWLSPIYDSPNDDNGYDIRDYCAIMREFGTMEDFDLLLKAVHDKGMRLIMDLVVNHTSDEHKWFQEAVSDKNSRYRDYYLMKKSDSKEPPNNWTSIFGGSAWNYYPEADVWALHLFSKKQMDLNWDNPKLRKDIYEMIRWWLNKGVDGFRLDVINYISKREGLPQGSESIGKMMGICGIEHYFCGPRLHAYLKEMRKEAFKPYSAFTVGEAPGAGMEMAKLLVSSHRRELDMIFSFDHLETPGHGKFDDYRYDLNYLKKYMLDWMDNYADNCAMSLFYENHDNPRMISKVDPRPEYRIYLAKLLAVLQMTLKGTPFIYQGQEIASVNCRFRTADDFRDVESLNLYNECLPVMGEAAAFEKVLSGSRDHARTPMQWDDSEYAGFTKGRPWIYMDDDYREWNVKAQLNDPNSVLSFYKKLISFRRNNKALIHGSFRALYRRNKDIFMYLREAEGLTYLVECNLSDKTVRRNKPSELKGRDLKLIICNYGEASDMLKPYEARLYELS